MIHGFAILDLRFANWVERLPPRFVEASVRKAVYFSHHVVPRMVERGTDRQEVEEAIRRGRQVPAEKGRIAFRLNLRFEQAWKGKYYGTKQVMPIVSEKPDRYVVITVLTFYF